MSQEQSTRGNGAELRASRLNRRREDRGASGVGEFLAMLSRRRWIWFPLFLIVLGISVVNYLRAPVFYRSTTKVLVSRGERESSLNPRMRFLRWEEELGSEVETILTKHGSEVVRAGRTVDRGGADRNLFLRTSLEARDRLHGQL